MDVRSIEDVEPVVEHNGTVPVWWLVNPREMKEITDGGFLELVSEFEVAGGGLVDPHSHAGEHVSLFVARQLELDIVIRRLAESRTHVVADAAGSAGRAYQAELLRQPRLNAAGTLHPIQRSGILEEERDGSV